MKKGIIILNGLMLSLLLAGSAAADIDWQVISGGGVRATSPSYVVSGTVGQTAVGSGTAGGKIGRHGFWQDFAVASFICGDVNNDGTVNVLDIIFLIDYKFKGGPAPAILASADVNSDGSINVLDIIFLIDFKFKGGPPPNCP